MARSSGVEISPASAKDAEAILADFRAAVEPHLESVAAEFCAPILEREDVRKQVEAEEGGVDRRKAELLAWLRGLFGPRDEGARRASRERLAACYFRVGLPIPVVVGCVSSLRQRLMTILRAKFLRDPARRRRAIDVLHRALDAELGGMLEEYERARVRAVEEARRRDAEAEIERERRESEERFRLVAEATNHAIWDWDISTDAVWWSEGFQKIFGYATGEAGSCSKWWVEKVHPADRERVKAGLAVALEARSRFWTDEYRFARADGTHAYVLDRGYVLFDEAGRPARMIGAMLDLTENRRIEREIRDQKEFVDRLIRSSRDGILAIDREQRFTLWNPAMERISGKTREEVLGRTVLETFPFVRETGEEEKMRASLAGEPVVTRKMPFSIPDTGRSGFYDAYSSPVHDENGEVIGALTIIRDVTEEERMRQDLVRAERLAAVGEIAAMIAHEVRNPITATRGVLQVLARRLPPSSEDRAAAAQTIERLDALSRLISDLLIFSRPIRPRMRTMEAETALRQIAEDLGREPEFEPLAIRFEGSPESGRIRADLSLLWMAFQNFARNALQAAGGRVEATLRTEREGDRVALRLEDRGPGIPSAVRDRLFAPFVSTKPGGTGLGLAMVKRIADALGGEVAAADRPGGGAVFSLLLPLAERK